MPNMEKIGNAAIKCAGISCLSEEGETPSTTDQVIGSKGFKFVSIIQIIIICIVSSIVFTLILLSGSIAVSGSSDKGTIEKIIIFIVASFFWIPYLCYYYIYIVLIFW